MPDQEKPEENQEENLETGKSQEQEPQETQPQEAQNKKNRKRGRTAAELVALKAEIVQRLDLVKFYRTYLGKEPPKQKKDGWTELTHCCIHHDTGKPNLSINLVNGGFKCFACGKAGSVFDFWCHMHGRDPKASFQDAVVALANEAGIDIDSDRPVPGLLEGTVTPTPKAFVPQARRAEAVDQRMPPLAKDLVKKYQTCLQSEHYRYLSLQRGLIDATIKRYNLGWNPDMRYKNREGIYKQGRFAIPIPNKDNEIRNIRLYAEDAMSEYKILNTKGYGSPPRIFPLHELLERKKSGKLRRVIVLEGEFDCMLLNQHLEMHPLGQNWLAITNTAGCNTWEPDWTEHLFDLDITFMFDVDPPGKQWAQTIATEKLMTAVSTGKIPSVQIVHIPLPGSKDSKDITDFFMKNNGNLEVIIQLIAETPCLQTGGVDKQQLVEECLEVENFVHCVMNREYIDQRVRVPLTISGQTTQLYHATRKLRVVDCPAMKEDNCCNQDVVIIPYGHESFIEACMSNRKYVTETLRNLACIKGKPCKIEEVEKVVCQEYYAHQRIKRLTVHENDEGRMVNSQELVNIPIYVLQPEQSKEIGPQDYIATGYVRSHPGTRRACLFVETLEPIAEDWKTFEVNPRSQAHLRMIQGMTPKEILKELSTGVTNVYKADWIMLTILLTYLSPRYFVFNGKIMRGWINACIIGDSGTGKTRTYASFADWVEVGDIFSMLTGSRTGLLYACKQKGVEWYVQIGRYVMASGKIIGVDETQEADPDEIKKLGKAMDEGWLDVAQVASGGYQTQTRALFLMNPKHNKKISDYSYGCQALIDCFHPMFIRRLDIAVFATGQEEASFYNQRQQAEAIAKMKLHPDMMRSLIYWAWTRTPDEIVWEETATDACLQKAIEMSEVYGQADDVPLVNPQDFRNNLARLSTAFAILSGGFSEDYTMVHIQAEHVEKMAQFLDLIYSSTACNLKQHAKNSARRKTLQKVGDLDEYDQIEKAVMNQVTTARNSPEARIRENDFFLQILWLLQQQSRIRLQDIAQQVGCNLRWVQRNMAILLSHDLIEFKHSTYMTTRKFNLFMHRWQISTVTLDGKTITVEQLLEEARLKIGQGHLHNPHSQYDESYYGSEYAGYGTDDPFMQP